MPKITPDQLSQLMKDNNLDIETLLDSIVDWMEVDKAVQIASHQHELVIACIDGAIESVKHASFNYYASYK